MLSLIEWPRATHGPVVRSRWDQTDMRALLTCLFLAIACPAFADMTAVYEAHPNGFKMTVEMAANGDVRGDIAGKPGVYVLTRSGQGYFVITTPGGVLVDRVEDEGAAVQIVAEKRLAPAYLTMMKELGRNMSAMGPLLVKGDDIVVQGRKGTPYYFGGVKRPGMPPVMVVSYDAELASLGLAMARQMALSDMLQPFATHNPLTQQAATIMKMGAPIEFAGAELTTITHDPIPPSRFELPAAPEGREAIVKRIDAAASDQRVSAF